jgi:hypothetical protein
VSDENNIPAVGAAINLDRLEKIISSEKFKWLQYCWRYLQKADSMTKWINFLNLLE